MLDASIHSRLGQQIHEARGTVSPAEFQRWAAAVGDLNPIYFDVDAAREVGHPDVVMPPLFISVVCTPVNTTADLKADGSQARDPMESVASAAARLMAAGDDLEVLAPVYPGDEITARCSIAGVSERQGNQGKFALVEFLWEYRNQHGRPVSTSRTSIIFR